MSAVLELVDRLNFPVCNCFNVVIMGQIEAIIKIKNWIEDNRGACEVGFVCLDGVKSSGIVLPYPRLANVTNL